jgi:hypothetical protein
MLQYKQTLAEKKDILKNFIEYGSDNTAFTTPENGELRLHIKEYSFVLPHDSVIANQRHVAIGRAGVSRELVIDDVRKEYDKIDRQLQKLHPSEERLTQMVALHQKENHEKVLELINELIEEKHIEVKDLSFVRNEVQDSAEQKRLDLKIKFAQNALDEHKNQKEAEIQLQQIWEQIQDKTAQIEHATASLKDEQNSDAMKFEQERIERYKNELLMYMEHYETVHSGESLYQQSEKPVEDVSFDEALDKKDGLKNTGMEYTVIFENERIRLIADPDESTCEMAEYCYFFSLLQNDDCKEDTSELYTKIKDYILKKFDANTTNDDWENYGLVDFDVKGVFDKESDEIKKLVKYIEELQGQKEDTDITKKENRDKLYDEFIDHINSGPNFNYSKNEFEEWLKDYGLKGIETAETPKRENVWRDITEDEKSLELMFEREFGKFHLFAAHSESGLSQISIHNFEMLNPQYNCALGIMENETNIVKTLHSQFQKDFTPDNGMEWAKSKLQILDDLSRVLLCEVDDKPLQFESFKGIVDMADAYLNTFSAKDLGVKTKEDIDFTNKIVGNRIKVGDKELSFTQKKELAERKYLKVLNVLSPKNRMTNAVLTLNEKGELNTEYHPLKEKKILNTATKQKVTNKIAKKGTKNRI